MPIKKPKDLCAGCPFYELSEYITPDVYVEDSEVYILAQAPGAHEEQGLKLESYEWSSGKKYEVTRSVRPQPLIGASGNFLQKDFWPYTSIDYNTTSRANVIKCRPYGLNELPDINGNKSIRGITPTMLKAAVAHCTSRYLKIPKATRYILAMGALSLYALAGEIKVPTEDSSAELDEDGGYVYKEKKESITVWRGWCLGKAFSQHENRLLLGAHTYGITDYYHPSPDHIKIFPVVHIASLFSDQKYFHATQYDYRRFGALVRGQWPRPLPEIVINKPPTKIPSVIGFDTEYTRYNELTMWSMADIAGNVYVTDAYVRNQLTVPSGTTVVGQNVQVDIPHFAKVFNVSSVKLHDCMLAHALLWPGEPVSLDYQLSKVGRYNRHKHLRLTGDVSTKYLYAGIDADTTLNDAWRACIGWFKRDELSWREYLTRRQPLLHVLDRFNTRGIPVWQQRVAHIAELLDQQLAEIDTKAKELTGNATFNIGSWQQVARAIYNGEYAAVQKPAKRTRKAKPEDKEQLLLAELIAQYGA